MKRMSLTEKYKRPKSREIAKSQSSNHSTPQEIAPKESFSLFSIKAMKDNLYNETEIEELAKALALWADSQKKVTRLNIFLKQHDIFYDDFMRLTAKYPILEKARKWAIYALGDKREEEAIYGSGRLPPLMASMPYYCPDWNEVIAWRASLNSEGKSSSEKELVVVEIPVERERIENRNQDQTKQIPAPRVPKTDH